MTEKWFVMFNANDRIVFLTNDEDDFPILFETYDEALHQAKKAFISSHFKAMILSTSNPKWSLV